MTLIGSIKNPLRPVFQKTIQLSASLTWHKYKYVFVLAHMRSGSTLLSHILGSHAEFAYSGESHIIYKTPADLQNLIIETSRVLRKIYLGATYVVDQINWPYVTEETLKSPLIDKCIILIREPEAALKSIISSSENDFGEKAALGYYINRLNALVEYGLFLKERALLVEYDDLVDRTDKTLAVLTNFFRVTRVFESNYKTNIKTGKPPFGDPSRNIWEQRVIRTQPHKIDIGEKVFAQATTAFENCRQQLQFAGVQLANDAHRS